MAPAHLLLILSTVAQTIGADRATLLSVNSHGAAIASRSAAILATDGGVTAHATSMSSDTEHLHAAMAVTATSHMIPGEGGRAMMKFMAGCICCLILFKLLSSIDCYSKRLDCRRCKMIARFLLYIGYDEFPGFRASVTVHSVADIVNKGMMGGEKQFKVKVAFKWSYFMTSSTGDMRWDQTKGMDVPQGAEECVITLYSEGKFKDTTLGEYVLETKRDMLDAKKFWGEKKKLKLESKGKLVGTILITFRNNDDPDGPGGGGDLPIDGVDEDSALAISIREAYEEMIKEGVVRKPEPKPVPAPAPVAEGEEAPPQPPQEEEEVQKLEGNLKIDLLGRCITGPLREVNKDGKEGGKTFIRVIHCNFAELKGDDMKSEMKAQWRKAQEKGLNELPKKWYWVEYEDKKAAYHEKKWHEPDGFFPMTAITKVNRQPERNDQFVISYTEDGDKNTLIYRRDGGKSLDVWLDGVDLCFNECRTIVKEEKENEERRKKGLPPL